MNCIQFNKHQVAEIANAMLDALSGYTETNTPYVVAYSPSMDAAIAMPDDGSTCKELGYIYLAQVGDEFIAGDNCCSEVPKSE